MNDRTLQGSFASQVSTTITQMTTFMTAEHNILNAVLGALKKGTSTSSTSPIATLATEFSTDVKSLITNTVPDATVNALVAGLVSENVLSSSKPR